MLNLHHWLDGFSHKRIVGMLLEILGVIESRVKCTGCELEFQDLRELY